ncbi:MAG: hypothetical protein JW797_14775 [Bradymonadales bacterium]|nr:hypothetical protein [Bradymonadales bacterium]
MMRRAGLVSVFALVLGGLTGLAWAEGEECTADSECAEGEACIMMPCAMPCDPDEAGACEETCDPVGMCMVVEEDPFWSECQVDEDCPSGFVCEEIGGVGCLVPPCPEGEECPVPPECEEETIYGCVPAPCLSDADCAPGLVCLSVTYEMCEGMARPDCDPEDDDCDGGSEGGEEVTCETYSESFCAPPYLAPCAEDADCGEGFRCVEAEECVCEANAVVRDETTGEGSSDSSGSEGGGATDEEEPEFDCTCEPSGQFYCEPQQIACEDNEDCPEGWICEDIPDMTTPCEWDEELQDLVCEEPAEEMPDLCMPPFWNAWGASSDGSGYTEALDEASGGNESRAMPVVVADPDDQTPHVGGGSGCQVATGRGTWAASLLGLFALVLAVRRRK